MAHPPEGAGPAPGPALELDRLTAIADHLGQPVREVTATLAAELERAIAGVDAGLADGDAPSVALAAHAARNSALMIGARPMLAALDPLETAARREDLPEAAGAAEGLHARWSELRDELARTGHAGG